MSRTGNATGNDRFVGFSVDLLEAIAREVGFRYAIHLTPEAKYGIYNPDTGEWNGIVRELIDRVSLPFRFWRFSCLTAHSPL